MSITEAQKAAILNAEVHGHLPSFTALRDASVEYDDVQRAARREERRAGEALERAWESLDAALGLTALGELEREAVIDLAMNTFGPDRRTS